MPDPFDILRHWWKQISGLVVCAMLAAGIIAWLKPLQYLSTSTALPASLFNSDKSRLFNENIQILYSELGTADDLDMIVGTAQLDTVYLAVTDQFNLYDHYQLQGDNRRMRAAQLLRGNSKVYKTDYGELKVKVWDTDKDLAPQLADAIMETLQTIHNKARNATNEATLLALKDGLKNTSAYDSSFHTVPDIAAAGKNTNYEKLISEYELMVKSKTPALVVIEKGRPSLKADRPRRAEILIITGVLSFLFAFLLGILLERKKLARGEVIS